MAVLIKVGWSYWSSLGHFTVPQFRRTHQDGFNRPTKRLSLKMILMKKVGTHTKSGRSIQVLNVPTWHLINKIKETGLTEHCKGSSLLVTATTEKTHWFLKSLFIRKKMNQVPTIPSGKSHLRHRSANHQFIAWSRKRIFIATNV